MMQAKIKSLELNVRFKCERQVQMRCFLNVYFLVVLCLPVVLPCEAFRIGAAYLNKNPFSCLNDSFKMIIKRRPCKLALMRALFRRDDFITVPYKTSGRREECNSSEVKAKTRAWRDNLLQITAAVNRKVLHLSLAINHQENA